MVIHFLFRFSSRSSRQHFLYAGCLDFSIHASFRFLTAWILLLTALRAVMATPHQMRPSQFLSIIRKSAASAPDISITLQTNVYTATFNALTMQPTPTATRTLFFCHPPSWEVFSNDASGNITYTRNPNLFGSDAFYLHRHGRKKADMPVGNVKILQQNTSGDSHIGPMGSALWI